MADEARTKIVIETDAELAGAQFAAGALERDIGKAKALGESFEEAAAKLKTAKAAIADYASTHGRAINATKELADENTSLAQYTEDSLTPASWRSIRKTRRGRQRDREDRDPHRPARKLFALAEEQLPGLGEALKGAFAATPLEAAIGAVGAIVGAIVLYKRRVDELVVSLGGLQLPDLSPPDPTKIDEATKSYHAMADAIRDAKEAYNSAGEASDRYLARLKAETDQQKTLLEGRKALELAALEQNKASMTADQFATNKDAIDNRYARAGLGVDERDPARERGGEMLSQGHSISSARLPANAGRGTAAIHVAGSDDTVNLADLKAHGRRRRDSEKAGGQQR